MGYFAVLSSTDVDRANILQCHLNLWCLPGILPGRRLLYLDVGLEIEAPQNATVKEFQLLLPFRVEEGKWPDGTEIVQDLYDSLGTDDITELVFGGPVVEQSRSGDNGRTLVISDYLSGFHLGRIDSAHVKPAPDFEQRPDSSLYVVPLQVPIAAGQRRYVRMRWRVLQAGHLWRHSRSGRAARLDFRVCDVRESRFVSKERGLRKRICEIKSINFFLMAPPKLQATVHSPQFKYLRVLEPGAWSEYLRGASYLGFARGLLVYYWKHPLESQSESQKESVSADNPFRVFVELYRRPTRSVTGDLVLLVASVLVALFLADTGWKAIRDVEMPDFISTETLVTILSLVGISVLSVVGKIRRWVTLHFLPVRRALRRIERGLLSLTHWG